MVEYTYPRNKSIKIELVNINPSSLDLTITTYEWKINNNIQQNNTNSIIINTNDINLGLNEVSWRIQNTCGSWSDITAITLNITSENVIYAKNKNLLFKITNINPGTPNLTITTYEWKINGIQIVNNTNTLNINTNNLIVGINSISTRIQNSCGSWSNINSLQIEVYKAVQKTFTIDINTSINNINIII